MNNRLKFLYGILIYLTAETIQLLIVYLLQMVYRYFVGLKIQNSEGTLDYEAAVTAAMSQDILYMISVIGVIVCGIVFFVWYQKEIRGEARRSIGSLLNDKSMAFLLFLGIGCQLFFTGIMSAAMQYFSKLFNDYADKVDWLTSGNKIMVLLLMIIIAPIVEELVFRGVILHQAKEGMPFVAANLLQALLFGVYHQNIIQGMYAAMIGFVLGLVYQKFKTIIASILLHMIINASSFIVVLFPDNVICRYSMLLVGGLFIISALYFMKRLKTPI